MKITNWCIAFVFSFCCCTDVVVNIDSSKEEQSIRDTTLKEEEDGRDTIIVTPDTSIDTDTIIVDNGDGMRIALGGIYLLLSSGQLYCGELTYGLVSVLGRDYDITKLPYKYRYLIDEGEWYETYSRGVIDPIWKKAYNVLANVNNLLQAVEKTDESFFEWGKLERNMFIAELHGLRALLHFDMLRLFAPAPINDDGKAYIPNVEKYPEYQPKKLTVNETMDKIEADLIAACDLLIDIDTSSTETDQNVGPYVFSPVQLASNQVGCLQ